MKREKIEFAGYVVAILTVICFIVTRLVLLDTNHFVSGDGRYMEMHGRFLVDHGFAYLFAIVAFGVFSFTTAMWAGRRIVNVTLILMFCFGFEMTLLFFLGPAFLSGR